MVTVDKATTVSPLLTEIEKQTGIKVVAGAAGGNASIGPVVKKPFWELLEGVAAKTNTRLTINGTNKGITFEAGLTATAASFDGPFRTSLKDTVAKIDGSTGQTRYTVALDVHWEPRFPVFRMDAQPRVTAAKDDLGNALTVRGAAVKSGVTGYSHTAEVRVEGLTRKATTIAELTGEFTVTASPKMLAFAFDDLATLPVSQEQDGVKATITKVLKREEVWEIQLAVEYRTPPPNFESFESWTTRNTFQLRTPKKTDAVEAANFDITAQDRFISAAYRFSTKNADLGSRKGWGVVCETPAPLVVFPVKFTLKDLKLP